MSKAIASAKSFFTSTQTVMSSKGEVKALLRLMVSFSYSAQTADNPLTWASISEASGRCERIMFFKYSLLC